MIGVRCCDLKEFCSGQRDFFATDGHQSLDDVFKSPLAILAFAVGIKQRAQALLHVPLQIVGQHAEKHMRPNAVVIFVENGP